MSAVTITAVQNEVEGEKGREREREEWGEREKIAREKECEKDVKRDREKIWKREHEKSIEINNREGEWGEFVSINLK